MEFDNTAPESASLTIAGWDNSPAIGVTFATASLVYFGSSESETLDEGRAKSELSSVERPGLAGTYACAEGGFKYLLVPLGVDAATTIRDLATGINVFLAGEDEGYGTVTNELTHGSLVIDGISYRVYRSAYVLGAEINLQVT